MGRSLYCSGCDDNIFSKFGADASRADSGRADTCRAENLRADNLRAD